MWREHDLDTPDPLPLQPEEVRNAVIVCSDVIEHVEFPDRLLMKLSTLLPAARVVLISTPERDLTRGPRDCGPPPNPHHVREWSTRELSALLWTIGLSNHTIGLTRSEDIHGRPFTILAAIVGDPSDVLPVADVLIDRPRKSQWESKYQWEPSALRQLSGRARYLAACRARWLTRKFGTAITVSRARITDRAM